MKSSQDTSVVPKADVSAPPSNPPPTRQLSKLATQSKTSATMRPAKQEDRSNEKNRTSSEKTKTSPPTKKEKQAAVSKNQHNKRQGKMETIVKTPSPTFTSPPKPPMATQGAVSNSGLPMHSKGKASTKGDRPVSEKVTSVKGRAVLRAPDTDVQKSIIEESVLKKQTNCSDSSLRSLKRGSKDRQQKDNADQFGWSKSSHIQQSSSSSLQDRNTSVSPVPSNQRLYGSHMTSSEKVAIVNEENVSSIHTHTLNSDHTLYCTNAITSNSMT